jgi:hypothetical protein
LSNILSGLLLVWLDSLKPPDVVQSRRGIHVMVREYNSVETFHPSDWKPPAHTHTHDGNNEEQRETNERANKRNGQLRIHPCCTHQSHHVRRCIAVLSDTQRHTARPFPEMFCRHQ